MDSLVSVSGSVRLRRDISHRTDSPGGPEAPRTVPKRKAPT